MVMFRIAVLLFAVYVGTSLGTWATDLHPAITSCVGK